MPLSDKSTAIKLGGWVRSAASKLRERILFLPQYWGCHTCSTRSSSRHLEQDMNKFKRVQHGAMTMVKCQEHVRKS